MHHSGTGGYCGSEYDRFVERTDDTALGKFKQQYYTAKQAIRSKFGKKEDEFLVASDAELDAKLAVYYSVKDSCENMLRCIERYQDYICEISQEENALGRFLKQRGKADKTQAGKMMSAVGRAQSFTAQQRLALRVPLVRLYQELEVFTERAVGDCNATVEKTEKARTEYRGSLLWMKKVSEELDPDTYRQLERFRKVQGQVKRKKAKFDKYKLDCLQKVDLLAASRCNLFSQLMANYQNCLLHFWERTSSAHNTVSENFKGYQHYEFTILKDLAEPSRRLAELTSGNSVPPNKNREEETEKAQEATATSEQQLISLEEQNKTTEASKTDDNRTEMERLLLKDSPEAEQSSVSLLDDLLENTGPSRKQQQQSLNQHIPKLPPPPGSVPSSGRQIDQILSELSLVGGENGNIPDNQVLEDLLSPNGNAAEDTFAFQWQQTFGKLDEITTGQAAAPVASHLPANVSDSPLHGPKAPLHGLLPSELLEMEASGINLATQTRSTTAAQGTPMPPTQKQSQSQKPPGQQQNRTSGQQQGQKKSAWFSLFADLDPLSNPDAIGKPDGDENNPC